MLFSKKNSVSVVLAGFIALAAMGTSVMTAHGQEAVAEEQQITIEDPTVFITGLVDKLRVLATEESVDADRKSALRLVLSEDMAVRRLQGYLLSRQQRKELSEEEVSEYNDLFPLYISSAFAGSIDQLVTRTIKVNDVLERRPGDFIVRSKLFSDDGQERASLDWRVLDKDGDLQLGDVMVDGLSFSVERRAQFTAILKKDGFEALISHMKEVAGETAS